LKRITSEAKQPTLSEYFKYQLNDNQMSRPANTKITLTYLPVNIYLHYMRLAVLRQSV